MGMHAHVSIIHLFLINHMYLYKMMLYTWYKYIDVFISKPSCNNSKNASQAGNPLVRSDIYLDSTGINLFITFGWLIDSFDLETMIVSGEHQPWPLSASIKIFPKSKLRAWYMKQPQKFSTKHCGHTGGHLDIKMLSYQYRDPHVKDKIVLSLTWESPYLGKTVFILK